MCDKASFGKRCTTISDVVDITTLADLVETADQLENESTPPMYYI